MSDPTRVPKRRDAANDSNAARSWKLWVLIGAIILLAVIVIQNSQDVRIKILFIETTTPLIVGLLIAGALGAIIGYVAPMVRRRHREDV